LGGFVLSITAALVGCGKSGENEAVSAAPAAATTVAGASGAGATNASSPAVTPASGINSVNDAVSAATMEAIEEGDPIIVMHTSLGSVYVRLYQHDAPRTVANFMDYLRTGHYNGTVFHQVEPGYVALGGAFDVNLKAKQVRYPVVSEATNGLKNIRGSLAMARDPNDPNSATSMFFINLADNPKLDHRGSTPEEYGFCVFAQVIDGLDVLDKLSAAKTGAEQGFTAMPTPHVVLNNILMMRSAVDRNVQPARYNKSSAVPRRPLTFPVPENPFNPDDAEKLAAYEAERGASNFGFTTGFGR
jgi:peptidyl-prolyl cis-trans isomerase B (cyclophilin B)